MSKCFEIPIAKYAIPVIIYLIMPFGKVITRRKDIKWYYELDCIGTRIGFINLTILIVLGPKLSRVESAE